MQNSKIISKPNPEMYIRDIVVSTLGLFQICKIAKTSISVIYISGFGLLMILEFCIHAGVFDHLEIYFLLIDCCSRRIFNLWTTSVSL